MKEKILKLINEDMDIEEVLKKVYNNECIAYELNEQFPHYCHEDADCYECWRLRIEKEY